MTRVLLIGPSNIGDAILSGAVLAALHQRYPGAHVTLMAGTRAKAVFAEDPRVQVLVDSGAFDSPAGRLKLAWALWRYHPNIVVDLRHTAYPMLLKPLECWRYLLRRPPRRMTHMRDRHLWKLRAHAPGPVVAEANGAAIWISAKDTAHVETLWRRWQLPEAARLIVICPGARSHIKRWSAEGFARVADRLVRDCRAHVVFAGEPDEEEIVQEILGAMEQRAVSAIGLTTIRQLGVLMRRARLVITNDSAALHLASAMQTPTLALFGPTDAAKYGPTAPRHRVIRRALVCAPCERALCRYHHECMRFISAEEVFNAASDLLEQGA